MKIYFIWARINADAIQLCDAFDEYTVDENPDCLQDALVKARATFGDSDVRQSFGNVKYDSIAALFEAQETPIKETADGK